MKITPHSVAAPSPEAFASLARSPFPSAPRYGREYFPFASPGRDTVREEGLRSLARFYAPRSGVP